jgi:hypothetical protein
MTIRARIDSESLRHLLSKLPIQFKFSFFSAGDAKVGA